MRAGGSGWVEAGTRSQTRNNRTSLNYIAWPDAEDIAIQQALVTIAQFEPCQKALRVLEFAPLLLPVWHTVTYPGKHRWDHEMNGMYSRTNYTVYVRSNSITIH